ncbi:WD domain/cytochrome c family protein [Candidatus Rhodobacter oscarellae]|uniref:WD domain/cytochrome c family protein n=2 Tax=Candidatus Rhodobacter oscarellae TaxID=1675527 RepID=A0A0J9E1H6_9RHOB|nr:WD domain/cytochrome c family protein [Candidatus Rhodobacter lobularis]
MALDVSPDGRLASASFDNSVGLWPGPVWLEGHDAAVTALDASQAPAVLSGGDDFRVLLLHPELETPLEITKHKGKIGGIAVDATSDRIASASWDGSIQLHYVVKFLATNDMPVPLDFRTFELLGHRSNVTSVGFAPNGTLYSASSDGTIRVWEGPETGTTSRVLVKHGFGINEIVVTEDWTAYGAVDGATRVIDHDGQQIADFTLDRRPILAMDYHADTGQLAVGDGHGYIMMIDTAAWKITRDFRAMRKGPVWALAFSNDGAIIHVGGIDDVIYAWPVALLDQYDPAGGDARSFLRDAASMPNGERQFMRKCSICHALEPGPSRKAGPTLHAVFGRRAGTVPGYRYSAILDGSEIVWDETTIDALFDIGPDHYIPGSKMPMQVIAKPSDRADLVAFLKTATKGD